MNSHLVVASTLLVAAAAAQAPAWTQLGGPAVTVSGTGALTRAPAGVGSVGVAWHDYVSGSTFAFGNPGWSIATTGTGPNGLMFAAMAGHQYAAVSFGGLTGTGMFSNLADGLSLAGGFATWGPAPSGPPARMMHSMTAVGTSYIVLFGGFDGANALNDVWTYSFFTSTWTPRVPTGLQPPPRTFASLSEGAGGTVVLFGGVDGSNQIVGDTWQLTFTFLSPTWAQIGGVAPSPRASAGMAWDPVRKVAVLQGGQVATGSLSDTWELRNDSGAPLWRSAITSG
ncbi:MAG: hypothetical protein KDE27_12345, partial [Planctomycetes bacterium]|nr:hypothetical protein [Planctomycetota bacterium]